MSKKKKKKSSASVPRNGKGMEGGSPNIPPSFRDKEYSESELTDVEIKPLITEVHSLRMQRVSWKVTCLLCLSIVVILLSIATVAITVTLLSYILVFPYHNHYMTKYTVDEGHSVEAGTVVSSIAGSVRQGLGFSWAYQRLLYQDPLVRTKLTETLPPNTQVSNIRILSHVSNQFLILFTLNNDPNHLHTMFLTDTGTLSNKTIVNTTLDGNPLHTLPYVLLAASFVTPDHLLVLYSVYSQGMNNTDSNQYVYAWNARLLNHTRWQFDDQAQLLHIHKSDASWVPGRPLSNSIWIPPVSAMGIYVATLSETRMAVMAQRDDLLSCLVTIYDYNVTSLSWNTTFNTSTSYYCRTGNIAKLQDDQLVFATEQTVQVISRIENAPWAVSHSIPFTCRPSYFIQQSYSYDPLQYNQQSREFLYHQQANIQQSRHLLQKQEFHDKFTTTSSSTTFDSYVDVQASSNRGFLLTCTWYTSAYGVYGIIRNNQIDLGNFTLVSSNVWADSLRISASVESSQRNGLFITFKTIDYQYYSLRASVIETYQGYFVAFSKLFPHMTFKNVNGSNVAITASSNALAFLSTQSMIRSSMLMELEVGLWRGGTQWVGVAITSGSSGKTIWVVQKGINQYSKGLIPGASYYADELGRLTLSRTDAYVGIARSSTELMISDTFVN